MWTSLRTAVSGMHRAAAGARRRRRQPHQAAGAGGQEPARLVRRDGAGADLPGRRGRRGQRGRGRPRDRQGRPDLGHAPEPEPGHPDADRQPDGHRDRRRRLAGGHAADGQAAYAHGGSLRMDGMRRLVTSNGAMVSPPIQVPEGIATLEIEVGRHRHRTEPGGRPPDDRQAEAGALREPGGAPDDRRERAAADRRVWRPDRGAGRRRRDRDGGLRDHRVFEHRLRARSTSESSRRSGRTS